MGQIALSRRSREQVAALRSRAGVDDLTNFVFARLRLKGGEDPRGAGRHPWIRVSGRRDLHDQIEWVVIPSTLLSGFFCEQGKLIWSRKVYGEQSVPSKGAPYRLPVGPIGGNPDRDARVLEWRRLEFPIPVCGEPFEPAIQEAGAGARIHFFSEWFEVVDVP